MSTLNFTIVKFLIITNRYVAPPQAVLRGSLTGRMGAFYSN